MHQKYVGLFTACLDCMVSTIGSGQDASYICRGYFAPPSESYMSRVCNNTILHPTFSHPQQGRIDFNTVNPSLSTGMDFLIHPCRWIDDEENGRTPPKLGRYCIRTLPRGGMYWVVSLLHQNKGGINTSRVLLEYGHSPHHQSIYRDGSGNPSLWTGKD